MFSSLEFSQKKQINHLKRLPGYFTLGFCLAIYISSMIGDVTGAIGDFKLKTKSILKTDRYRYGDLYGMSYIPEFRKQYKRLHPVPQVNCFAKKEINLYTLCDSYLYSFALADSFYCGVNQFYGVKNINPHLEIKVFDSSKKNIVLLEFTERFFLYPASDEDSSHFIKNFLIVQGAQRNLNNTTHASLKTQFISSLKSIRNVLFNSNFKSNLEFNVWETALFSPIKEFKANINNRWFERTDEKVCINRQKQQLYFAETVDTSFYGSSFRFISDNQIERSIINLNNLYAYFKNLGFDEVYLTIIPNPVSVIDPTYKGMQYNQLVPRILENKKLLMKTINVYDEFKQNPQQYYQASDTHWNAAGVSVWLQKFNAALKTHLTVVSN